MNKFLILAAAIAFVAPATAQEENTLELSAVPQAAMDAALARAAEFGVTEFTTAQMDDDEGTETYELGATMSSGMMLEVDVLADGTIEEVEEQIAADALPEAVTATLNQNLAGFTPTYVEKSTRTDGTVVYEFEGTHQGMEIDAEINEDGSNFVQNEDTAG